MSENSELRMIIHSRLAVVLAEHNQARSKRGLKAITVRVLAIETGLARSTLAGLMNNRNRQIAYSSIELLCKYFAKTPGDLFEHTYI